MPFSYEEERKPKPPPVADEGVWSDAADLFKAAGNKAIGDVARTGSYLITDKGFTNAEKLFKTQSQLSDVAEARARKTISPRTTEAISGWEGFTKDPLRAVVGHAAQSIPEMAATSVGGAVGALGGPAGTRVGLGAVGYGASATRMIGEMASQLNSASNSDLIQQSPTFAKDVASGMSYAKARERLLDKMVKASNVNTASAIYGGANALFGGVAGAAARTMTSVPARKAVTKVAKEIGKTALEEGVQEGIQNPVEDIVSQQGRIASGAQKQFDPYQTARASAEGAALGVFTGGALGAPIHIVGSLGPKPKLPPEVIPLDQQVAIEAADKTSSVPSPVKQASSVDAMATAAQQAATSAQPPAPPAAPVQPPVAPAPAAPTITPETAPAPAPAPARPVVTEEEFLNNADQPDPDIESEILTAPTEAPLPMEVTPAPAPEPVVAPAPASKKAKAKKTKLPPQPKGTEGVALTPEPTPVVAEEVTPTPTPETPAPVEVSDLVTPDEKAQPKFVKQEEPKPVPPQPKFVKPKEAKILPDIAKEKAYKAERAKEAAAAQTAKKRAVPKGETVIEGVRPDNLVRNFETKMLKGESADPTGKRPALVAELVAKREKAANKGEAVKINKALRALAKQEAVDQTAKVERDAKEATEAEAKIKRDRTPTQKVAEIASKHDLIPARAFEKAPPKSRAMTILKQLRNIGKALDDAEVPANSSPFETGVRALLDRVRQGGQQVTVDDIQKLNEYQDKAVAEVETAPEEIGSEASARKAIKKAAKQAAETTTEEARTEEVTAETAEQTELTDEQRTSEYTDLKVGKESSRKGPVRGIGTEGAASEGRKFSKAEIDAMRAQYERKPVASQTQAEAVYEMSSSAWAADMGKFGPSVDVRLINKFDRGSMVSPVGVSTVKELLANTSYVKAATSYLSDIPGLAGSFGTRIGVVHALQRIARAVTAEAPNTKVYLIDRDTMTKLRGNMQLNGYFDPRLNAVILRSDLVGTSKFTTVALHEAIHAAYHEYIFSSPDAKHDMEALYKYVKDNHSDKFEGDEATYAMASAEEFLTEALSNPEVQTILSKIELPASLNKQLGVEEGRTMSALRALYGMIAKALGVKYTTVFEGILTIQSKLEEREYTGYRTPAQRAALVDTVRRVIDARPMDILGNISPPPTQGPPQQGGNWWHSPADFSRRAWLKARAFGQLVEDADRYFGGSADNMLRKVHTWSERRRVVVARYIDEGDRVVRKSLMLSRQFPQHWENFATLQTDASVANVHPDVALTDPKNAHLGKEALMGMQAKARHADLHARWMSLPQELKDHWHEIGDFTTKRQDDMTLNVIENLVEVGLEKPDPVLAKRLFEDTATDADWALFKTNTIIAAIHNALGLKRIQGFYAPLIREGEYVVRGTYDLNKEDLMGGTVLGDDVVQFIDPTPGKRGGKTKARKTAIAFAEKSDLKAMGFHRLFVDPNDTTKQVPADDPKGVLAYRVKMQVEHMEFTNTAREAEQARADLQAMDNIKDVKGVERRQPILAGGKPDMLASEFSQLADKIVKVRGEGAISKDLAAALREMSVRTLGSTRIQSRRLPRRFVKGYSTDATHALSTYNVSSAGYLGKLETQPQIDKHLEEARDFIKTNATDNAKSLQRSEYYQETVSRITDLNSRVPTPVDRWVNTVLSLSQMDKLMSPSYHMINALQTIMVTIPVISGRHGVRATVKAMADAYTTVGAGAVAWNGLADTAKAGKSAGVSLSKYIGSGFKRASDLPPEVTDYLGDLRKRLTKAPNGQNLLKLFDELDFLISPDASFEAGRLTGNTNAIGTAIKHGEFIGRQVGQAVETVNRATTAIAAFNLEMARNGGNVDAAIMYAKDTVNDTHFNYSQTNAPAFMMDKHPIWRLALQFKKYAQSMVYLMVKLGHTAISKESDPKVRREAALSLAYVLGTTAAMAGALGLPTEMFKIGVMVLNLFGFMDDDWDDVERWVEENFGTVAARGLPNLFGVDVSTRMGLNNALLYGQPGGDDAKSRWAWFGQLIAGAPGGYAMDVASSFGKIGEATNSMLSGDYAQAGKATVDFMDKTVPIRMFSDMIATYRMATEGKVNKRGEVITEPSIARAALRAFGFTSTQEAVDRRKANYMRADVEERDAIRQGFFDEWKKATTADERREIFDRVKAFNRTVPKKAQVTWKALQTSAKRAKKTTKVKGVYLGRDADLAQP